MSAYNISTYLDSRGRYNPIQSEKRRQEVKSLFTPKWSKVTGVTDYRRHVILRQKEALNNIVNTIFKTR